MNTSTLIDWESSQSHILLNPGMPLETRDAILATFEALTHLPGHIWLATSGSGGNLKFVALSKKAILISAAAVNKHLEHQSSDLWFNCLPTFHIGGLAINARCYLSGAKIVEVQNSSHRWNPHQFIQQVLQNQATLTSLVPAQVFDLVKEHLSAPSSLRAIVVGGGALNESVYQKAVALGWKILPSYGSTECASQIATAPMYSWDKGHFPHLKPLDHVKIVLDQEGKLKIMGESLLSYYAVVDEVKNFKLYDPKVEGWLTTEDRVIIEKEGIKSISRDENFIKIGGESVDLLRLDKILEEINLLRDNKVDMAIFAMPDNRLGHVIHLAIGAEARFNIDQLLSDFHARVHPFERIRKFHFVPNIPKTSLKKVIRPKILEMLRGEREIAERDI